MRLYKYTEQQLREAVKTCFSKRQVLLTLGVIPAGGNYSTLNKAIKYFNLDISHFRGQGWNIGKKFPPKRSIEDYLSNSQTIQSYKLKDRLIKENIFSRKCFNCKLELWELLPIPLELHHKNGNSNDNTLENLELLCPNCHALTSNYRGRAKRKV